LATEISDITSKVTLENQFSKEADKVVASTAKIDAYWEKLAQRADKDLERAFSKAEKAAEQFAARQEKAAAASRGLGSDFSAMTLSIAGGLIVLEAVGQAFRLAWEEGTKLVKLLPEMALEGSKISGVTTNFERLALGVGKVSTELLGALHEGTHRTIDDFSLITKVNSNLAAGLDLTAEQYRVASQGAFALAQATGIGVKEAFDKVNQALLTGQTRTLAQITGRINMQAAEEKYAKSIGTTVDHLSEAGKLEAQRLGILDALASSTNRLGVQIDGIGEFTDQLAAIWANFNIELDKTVANSPALLAAFEGVRDAVQKIFDENQADVIKRIASYIDAITIALIELAEIAVRVFVIIGSKVAGFIVDLKEAHLTMLTLEEGWASFKAGTGAAASKDPHIQELRRQIGEAADDILGLIELRDHAPEMSAAIIKELEGIKDKVRGAARGAADAWRTEFVGPVENSVFTGPTLEMLNEKPSMTRTTAADTNKVKSATEASIKATAALWDQYFDVIEKHDENVFKARTGNIERWYQAERDILDKSKENNKNYTNQLIALNELKAQKIIDENERVAKALKEMNDRNLGLSTNRGESTIGAGLPKQDLPLFTMLQSKQWATQTADIETQAARVERAITSAMNNAAKSVVPLTKEQERLIQKLKDVGFTTDQISAIMEKDFGRVGNAIHRFASNNLLGELSGAFADLAQISGDSFGEALKLTGQLMSSANIAMKAIDGLQTAIAAGTATTADYFSAWMAGISLVIQGAMMLSNWLSRAAEQQHALFMAKYDQADFINQMTNSMMGYAKSFVDAINNAKTLLELQDALKKAHEQMDLANEASSKFGPSQGDLITQWQHAKELYDFMLKSGMYTAEQLKDAWDEVERAANRAAGLGRRKDGTTETPEDKARREQQAMEDAAKEAGYVTQEELQKAADKAQKLYEYMRDSGKYTAEQIEDAFKKAQDAADKAIGINTQMMEKLKAEYDALSKAVEAEAPEAEMGSIEKAQRARMDQLKKEMEAEQARIDAAREAAMEKQAKTTGEATGKALAEALKIELTDSHIDMFGPEFEESADAAAEHTTTAFDASGNAIGVKMKVTAENMKSDFGYQGKEAAEEVTSAFDGKEIRIPIHWDYDPIEIPEPPNPNPKPMALGGAGHATGPMTFSTLGNEDFAFSGEGKSFADVMGSKPDDQGAASTVNIDSFIVQMNVSENVDPAALERNFLKILRSRPPVGDAISNAVTKRR